LIDKESREDWVSSLQRERMSSEKSWQTALVLSVLFGWAGADRFYVRRAGLGILKLLTCGGIVVWWVLDVVLLLREQMIDGYGRTLRRAR
jgi:TM2 domain-containing membrane protein YozV